MLFSPWTHCMHSICLFHFVVFLFLQKFRSLQLVRFGASALCFADFFPLFVLVVYILGIYFIFSRFNLHEYFAYSIWLIAFAVQSVKVCNRSMWQLKFLEPKKKVIKSHRWVQRKAEMCEWSGKCGGSKKCFTVKEATTLVAKKLILFLLILVPQNCIILRLHLHHSAVVD